MCLFDLCSLFICVPQIFSLRDFQIWDFISYNSAAHLTYLVFLSDQNSIHAAMFRISKLNNYFVIFLYATL